MEGKRREIKGTGKMGGRKKGGYRKHGIIAKGNGTETGKDILKREETGDRTAYGW